MSQEDSNRVSAALKLVTLAICIFLPLGVSSMHGGNFLKMLGGEGGNGYVMLAMACCFIFSMPILSTWVGHCFDSDRTGKAITGILACAVLIIFSNLSSTLALHSVSGGTINKQVNESAEVTTFRQAIENNNKAINGLQEQIDGRDAVRWASKRTGWTNEISKLQNENLYMLQEIKSLKKDGNGSSAAQAFIALEEYGVTLFGLSALAAALLDIVPFVAGLMLGGSGRRYVQQVMGETDTGKKNKAHLQAVA